MTRRPTILRTRLPDAGEHVRVIANTNDHDYQIGKIYIATADVHADGTAFRARDPDTGKTANWLSPDDIVIIPRIGWEWLRTVLPPQDVALLSAFEGLDALTLKPEVKDTILTDLTALEHAILSAVTKPTPSPRGGLR